MILTYKLHRDDYHVNASVQVTNQVDAYRRIVEEHEKGYDVTNVELTGCVRHGRKCLWCQAPAMGTVPVENIGRGDVCWECAAKHDNPDTRLGFDITRHSGEWTGD